MNVKGVLTGVMKNTDKIGGLLGFLTGSMHGFEDVQSSVENILAGQVHMPDIKEFFSTIASEPFVKNGVMLWIIGYVMKELKLPIVSKYGNPLSKFGLAYAGGAAAQKLLWLSTHSDQGSDPNKSTFQNFANAPAIGYKY